MHNRFWDFGKLIDRLATASSTDLGPAAKLVGLGRE